MKKLFTVDDVIESLRKLQGDRTNADFSSELDITQAYLGDIYAGRRTPGPAVLRHLGLVKEVFYRRAA